MWISLLLATALFADAPPKGGFYPEEKLKFRPAGLENALASVRRIQATQEDSCSSVFISHTGYVLTNIHCLTRCNELAAENPAEAGVRAMSGVFKGVAVEDQRKFVNFCNAHRKERAVPYYVEPDLVGEMEMVWAGRGRVTVNDDKLPDADPAEVETIKNSMNDYVILKTTPKEKGVSCLPVSELPAPGAWSWVIGFPAWNKRENGLGASGADKLVSYGTVRASVAEDPILQALAKPMEPAAQEKFWQRAKAIYDRADWLRTDADAFSNNSGGAIVDADGHLAALLFSVTKVSFDGYAGATVLGVSAAKIRAEVAKSLGAKLARQIFACE